MEPFSLPYFREALAEILLLAVPCGLIGSWVVLRGFAFHSHAVGTAAFPGLVLADGLGFTALLGAAGAAAAFTLLSVGIARSRRTGSDAVTALALAACLAAGVILASDVFGSGAGIDTLLFGSLLSIGPGDLGFAAAAAVVTGAASVLFGHHWLADGFDPAATGRVRPGRPLFNAALLAVIGLTVIAALGAVGALLVSTLIVVPAATVRLFATRLRTLQVASVALIAVEGIAGLWLSARTDAPPGATIAVVSGTIFVFSLAARTLLRHGRTAAAAAASAVLVAGLVTLGVAGGATHTGDRSTEVVATTTQVGDLVREIGGERTTITTILRPGTDPHGYEPRPSDVNATAQSRALFRSGGDIDRWARDLVRKSGSDARIVNLGRNLTAPLREGHGHGKPRDDSGPSTAGLDPHWWQDPVNLRSAARRVETELALLDPVNAGFYRHRFRRFRRQLDRITTRITACVAEVPAARRKIVTDHDAFGYFTRRFGIESSGTVMPALAAGAQPSAADVARLEETIRTRGVPAIFPGNSSSAAVAEAVARDTGITVGRPLYTDSLGPPGTPGATLLGSLKANADSVVEAISGGSVTCFGGSDG